MKASRISVWFVVAASLFGPDVMVRGASGAAYVNTSCRGYQLIANPLSNRENRIDQVLPWAPEGTQLITFDGGNWLTNEYLQGVWTFPDLTLSPGDGAILLSPTNWIQTWVGSILEGELKVLIPAGVSLRSSLVPQEGKISEVLKFPKVAGTKIYKVDGTTGQLVLRATCTDAGWEPEEPSLWTSEAVYIDAPHEFVWSRSFQAFAPLLTISQDNQRRGMVLTAQAALGRKVTFEISTDLIRWTELGGAEPIDPNSVLDRSPGQAARFYRLRLD